MSQIALRCFQALFYSRVVICYL
uniref:Uncharacterized protein n=1 Tax=Arundo donax TaxID=35708 RepID=A0A0A9ATG1_ARUDO